MNRFGNFPGFLLLTLVYNQLKNSLILEFLQEIQTQRHSQRAELKHVIALTKACHSTN